MLSKTVLVILNKIKVTNMIKKELRPANTGKFKSHKINKNSIIRKVQREVRYCFRINIQNGAFLVEKKFLQDSYICHDS